MGVSGNRPSFPKHLFSRSHAPAGRNAFPTRQRRVTCMPLTRDAGAPRIGFHAGAWEPEKQRRVGTRKCINAVRPATLARRYRRSHAGAWERGVSILELLMGHKSVLVLQLLLQWPHHTVEWFVIPPRRRLGL